MDQIVFGDLVEASRTSCGHARWTQLDDVYSKCRRQLRATNGWRYGPDRVHEVIDEAYRGLMQYANISRSKYCDMGCGRYHPFGNSAIMFLNGASSATALDIQGAESVRAAEALADLLCDCMANPDRWHISSTSRASFIERIRQFDLAALQHGDLQGGISDVPLTHLITDVHSPNFQLGQVDIMSSRAVLEHFQDLPRATDRLLEMMRPGGVGYHLIDVVDHRAYVEPSRFHYWSFFAEPDDWTDGLVNRLRPTEIRRCFEDSGFQILDFQVRLGTPPAGFREGVSPRFRVMSEEDFCATGVVAIVQRPKEQ